MFGGGRGSGRRIVETLCRPRPGQKKGRGRGRSQRGRAPKVPGGGKAALRSPKEPPAAAFGSASTTPAKRAAGEAGDEVKARDSPRKPAQGEDPASDGGARMEAKPTASEASAHETEAYKALVTAVFKAIGTKVGRRSSIAFSTGEFIATSSGTMTYNPDVGVNIKNTAYAPIDRDHMDPDHRARFDATWAEIRALAVRAAEQGAETKIRIGRPLGDSEYFNLHQDTFLCASYYPPREDAPKRSAAEDEAPPAKRPTPTAL